MTGKLFGLLTAAIVLAGQAASYGGCYTSYRCCHVSHHCCYHHHHCCYVPHCCWKPCPPCPPPVPCGCDCIKNATNKVLYVRVTHSGGSEIRSYLKPGYWYWFSFNPAIHRTAHVFASDVNTGTVIVNRHIGLVNHPSAPHGCIQVREGYAPADAGSLERDGAPVPVPADAPAA